MTNTQKIGNAGRLFECNRLITSGTSNPASVRHAQVVVCETDKFDRLQQHPSGAGRQNPGTIIMNWTISREAV